MYGCYPWVWSRAREDVDIRSAIKNACVRLGYHYAPIPQAVYNSGLEFWKCLMSRMHGFLQVALLLMSSTKAGKVSPVQLGVAPQAGTQAPCKAWVQSKPRYLSARLMVIKKIVDHYVPFVKELEAGYAVPFAIRGIASPRLDYNGGINTPIDSICKRFSGKMLLAVEARGELWYVHHQDNVWRSDKNQKRLHLPWL